MVRAGSEEETVERKETFISSLNFVPCLVVCFRVSNEICCVLPSQGKDGSSGPMTVLDMWSLHCINLLSYLSTCFC